MMNKICYKSVRKCKYRTLCTSIPKLVICNGKIKGVARIQGYGLSQANERVSSGSYKRGLHVKKLPMV